MTDGASGGSAANSVGDVVFSGGNGGNAVNGSNTGGGGSSAGSAANGNNASGSDGASAPSGGGDGGNGKRSPQGNGSPGSIPGGGGGGAYRSSSGTRAGGNGAAGRITIEYASMPAAIEVISFPQYSFEGKSSESIKVQIVDPDGLPARCPEDIALDLGSDLDGAFRDHADYRNISTITLPAGQSEATFRYRGAATGTHELSISDAAGVLTAASAELKVLNADNYPQPVQYFYIPLPEGDMLELFRDVSSYTSGQYYPANPLYRYTGISLSAPAPSSTTTTWRMATRWISVDQPASITRLTTPQARRYGATAILPTASLPVSPTI